MSRTWRPAGPADAVALRDLEREANRRGLAHVFPQERFPFPDQAVLDRWERVLVEPAVSVLVCEDPDAVGFVAFDEVVVRHLAVRPDRWGQGIGADGLTRAVASIRARRRCPRLWVLVDNERARRLYAHLGWLPTGREQPAEWIPYPVELEMELGLAGSAGA